MNALFYLFFILFTTVLVGLVLLETGLYSPFEPQEDFGADRPDRPTLKRNRDEYRGEVDDETFVKLGLPEGDRVTVFNGSGVRELNDDELKQFTKYSVKM